MRKKTCSIVALLAAVMVLLSVFAACAKGREADFQTEAASSSDATDATEPEYLELSVLFPENATWKINPDAEFFRIVQEKTGTRLTINTIPDVDYIEKRNLMIAGGNIPDIMYVNSAQDVMKFAKQGILLALDTLIDTSAPNIARYMTPEERKKVQCSDGKVYSIPRFYDKTIQYYGWMARKDILDANGISVPQTLDEFYDMLKRLKKIYPESYPFIVRNSVRDEMSIYRVFRGLFGEDNLGYPNYLFFRDEKWKISGMEETSKEILLFIRKLYTERLIDPEFSIISTQQWEQEITTGKSFVTHDYMLRAEYFNNAVRDKNPDFNLDIIPVPKKEGITPSQWVPDKLVDWAQFVINSKTADPDGAIRFMDFFYSPEGVDLTNWGIEGKTYEVVGNKKQFLPNVITASNHKGTVDIKKDYLVQYIFMGVVDADAYKQLNLGKNSLAGFELYEKYNYNMKIPPYVTSAFTQEEADKVTQIKPLIEKHIVENFTEFIMGTRSFDEWEEFQEELKILGVEDLLKIYQDAYERKYKRRQD